MDSVAPKASGRTGKLATGKCADAAAAAAARVTEVCLAKSEMMEIKLAAEMDPSLLQLVGSSWEYPTSSQTHGSEEWWTAKIKLRRRRRRHETHYIHCNLVQIFACQICVFCL